MKIRKVRQINKQELIEIKEQYKSKCIMLKRIRYNSQLSQKDLDLLKIYTYINTIQHRLKATKQHR